MPPGCHLAYISMCKHLVLLMGVESSQRQGDGDLPGRSFSPSHGSSELSLGPAQLDL